MDNIKLLGRNDYLSKKTTEQNIDISNKTISEREITIGKITYTIVSHFSDTSKDTVEDKIERLIKRDLNAS